MSACEERSAGLAGRLPTRRIFIPVVVVEEDAPGGAGLITGYLGLIVTMPPIGHATWHAYGDLVVWDEE